MLLLPAVSPTRMINSKNETDMIIDTVHIMHITRSYQTEHRYLSMTHATGNGHSKQTELSSHHLSSNSSISKGKNAKTSGLNVLRG